MRFVKIGDAFIEVSAAIDAVNPETSKMAYIYMKSGCCVGVDLPAADVVAALERTPCDAEAIVETDDPPCVRDMAAVIHECSGYAWIANGPGEGPLPAVAFLKSFWATGSCRIVRDCQSDETIHKFEVDGPQGGGEGWAKRHCLDVARRLWSLGYTSASGERPDPIPAESPAPDPAALLAEGKRLRFVRIMAGTSGRFGDDLYVHTRRNSVAYYWLGEVASTVEFEGDINAIQTKRFMDRRRAAEESVALLRDLGYRFDSVID